MTIQLIKPSVIQKLSELWPLEMNQGTEKQLSDLLSKYITYLASNINDRFQESLPVVSAFQVLIHCLFQMLEVSVFLIMVKLMWKQWQTTFIQNLLWRLPRWKTSGENSNMILQTGKGKLKRNSRPRRRQLMDNQHLVQKGQLPPQECSSRKSRLRKSQKLRRDTNRQQELHRVRPLSSSPLPYAVFAPTLFEFDPIKSSSPLDWMISRWVDLWRRH